MHLNIPKIRSLDLRPTDQINDIVWDWPIFPARVAEFIRSGELPKKVIKISANFDFDKYRAGFLMTQ